MDFNEKLDKIDAKLDMIIERQQELEETVQDLREAIAERGLPGSGYSTFELEED